MAIDEFCRTCGTQMFKRTMPCPDGRSGCAVLHYQLYCPKCEHLAKIDADAKLERLILRKFREETWGGDAAHLAACEDARARHPQGEDSSCGEGTCEIVRIEAMIKCPHGKAAEFDWHDWGTLAELFKEMDRA